jgi:hypothetical protein
MILNYLCPPALLYAVIMLVYIILELSNENYHEAFVKGLIGIIFTCILQAFCQMNFGIVSWIIVMIPIVFYTYITLLVFWMFGLNPDKKSNVGNSNMKSSETKKPIQSTTSTYSPNNSPSQLQTNAPTQKSTYAPLPTADPRESSFPIITSLYTPTEVDFSIFTSTPPPTSSESSDSSELLPNLTSVPETRVNLLKNLPDSDFCDTFIKRPNHDKSTDESDCNDFSICSWNGKDCVTNNDYYNDVNTLITHCNNLHRKSCSIDDLCTIDKTKGCIPSNKGFYSLINNTDCKVYLKHFLNDFIDIEKDPIKKDELLKEHKSNIDNAMILGSDIIDKNGCAVTFENIFN